VETEAEKNEVAQLKTEAERNKAQLGTLFVDLDVPKGKD